VLLSSSESEVHFDEKVFFFNMMLMGEELSWGDFVDIRI
jgi:hypothetical protein